MNEKLKEVNEMTIEEAREKAELKVNSHMNKSLIEYECERRGIKVSRSQEKMKQALIDAYIEEWSKVSYKKGE